MLAHNGEINTVRGNRLWMEARESVLKSELLGDLKPLFPIVQPAMSDSASLDNVFEFLVMAGKSLPHALAMLVPESWNQKNLFLEELRGFMNITACLLNHGMARQRYFSATDAMLAVCLTETVCDQPAI